MLWYEVIIRLFLAIVIGGCIGYERENKNRPAGFRTHILVCIGAAVASMIQVYAIDETSRMILMHPSLASALKADIGRLGAQVIVGVGFLGAGTIMHEKGSIKGLTTAASIWVVACIGLSIGLGYYFLSIFSTVAVFIVLVSLKKFEARFFHRAKLIKLEIQYTNKLELIARLEEYFTDKNIRVQNIEFVLGEEDTEIKLSLYTLFLPRSTDINEIVTDLCLYDEIVKVTLE